MAAFSGHSDTHMYVRETQGSLYKPDQSKCTARNIHEGLSSSQATNEGTEQRIKTKQHKHAFKRMQRSQTKQRTIWKPNQMLWVKIPMTVCHTPLQGTSFSPWVWPLGTHTFPFEMLGFLVSWTPFLRTRQVNVLNTHTFLSICIWFYFHFIFARQNSSAGQCCFGCCWIEHYLGRLEGN